MYVLNKISSTFFPFILVICAAVLFVRFDSYASEGGGSSGVKVLKFSKSHSRRAVGKEDRLLHYSRYCTRHFSRQERKYGLPKYLLMAIAATESGRWHKEAGMPIPWPWTANVEGKGYYFKTKHEAVTTINRFRQQGIESIDIGCMQINLKHHPKAFASVGQGFNPAKNVEYAAKFLRKNYNELGSWDRAIAAYHSRTKSKGRKYFAKVKKNWRRVVAAIQGGSGGKLGDDRNKFQLATDASTSANKSRKKKHSSRNNKKKRRNIPRMKIIKVSMAENQPPSTPEVLVIRPDSGRKPNVTVVNSGHTNMMSDVSRYQNFVTSRKKIGAESTTVKVVKRNLSDEKDDSRLSVAADGDGDEATSSTTAEEERDATTTQKPRRNQPRFIF